jgi:anti-sigma regulatory factor (Ser/Thr protein kinase)
VDHGRNDELHLGLPADPVAVSTARRCAVLACQQWAVSAATAEMVALVVSELSSNVVGHVGGVFRLLVRRERGVVRVEVEDSLDCPPPRALKPDNSSERGRGLLMVERVARSWGCEPTADGKRMWALLAG